MVPATDGLTSRDGFGKNRVSVHGQNRSQGSGQRPDLPSLQETYGRGYFHGSNSGYPSGGYASAHPDWKGWLQFLQLIKPQGVLLDLGCAYGYLVQTARQFGYRSFGFDISAYALRQEPAMGPFLVQAHLKQLPVADACAGVVALFDVLEHLEDPGACLRESLRVLRPDGILVGATPDPLFFGGSEPTHIFERPPAYWIDLLRKLGLSVQFRFSVEPYNFQFVAARCETLEARKLRVFQHDFFAESGEFLTVQGAVTAVPRWGWGALRQGGRLLKKAPASVYLLNPDERPARLEVSFRVVASPDFSILRLRCDSLVLKELFLSSQELEHSVQIADLLIPSGGHHLFFDLFPGGPEVRLYDLRVDSRAARSSRLILNLPFDLYQRYRLAAEICQVLRPHSVLDVGGLLGDRDGHLASPADFLAEPPAGSPKAIRTTDVRHCDHWHHDPAWAWEQPFEEDTFDLVVSLDVLEHLPSERRIRFLEELDRVARNWILLGAPFASLEVEAAEEALAGSVLGGQRFVQEHRELGLPEGSLVREFFQERGYSVRAFPNGYLTRWKQMQALTQHYFGFHDFRAFQDFNRLYNERFYESDQKEPAYRTLFLVSKNPLSDGQESEVRDLLRRTGPEAGSGSPRGDALFVELHSRIAKLRERRQKALTDVQFLINERQRLIGLLNEEVRSLRRELEETPLWRLARRLWRERKGLL